MDANVDVIVDVDIDVQSVDVCVEGGRRAWCRGARLFEGNTDLSLPVADTADSIPTSAITPAAVTAITQTSASKMTALHYALVYGNPDVVDLLLRFECCQPVVFGQRYARNAPLPRNSGLLFDHALVMVEDGRSSLTLCCIPCPCMM